MTHSLPPPNQNVRVSDEPWKPGLPWSSPTVGSNCNVQYSFLTDNIPNKPAQVVMLLTFLGGAHLKPWPGHQLSWGFSELSSVPWDARIVLKLDHDCSVPHSFPFIIHLSPYQSTLHSLSYWAPLTFYTLILKKRNLMNF